MKKGHLQRVFIAVSAALCSAGLSGCSKTPDVGTGAEAAARSPSAGAVIDDATITGRVKAALLGDINTNGFEFRVETHKGEVQLWGFVQTLAQFERAAELGRSIPGVRGVLNHLALKGEGPGSGAGGMVDDSIITARVKAALLADASVNSGDVSVVTRSGDVQLSGLLINQRQIERAVLVARRVQNVAGVSNEMRVKQ